MNKIELTREELTTILQVATGNVKDFVMDSDNFIDEQLKAINYIPCCKSDSEQLLAVAKYVYWNYDESSSKKPEDYLKDFTSQ
jgi:hypothetical protein